MWQLRCVVAIFAVGLADSNMSTGVHKVYLPTLRTEFDSHICALHCHHQGMELASINSAQENDAALSAIRANEMYEQNLWIGGNIFYKQWFWHTNQQPFTYTNWNSGRPLSDRPHRCVLIKGGTGKWTDTECNPRNKCLCERSIDDSLAVPRYSDAAKTSPYVLNKVFIIKSFSLDWNDAKYSCSNNNMKLATIENPEENKAAIAAMKKAGVYSQNVWISSSMIDNKWVWNLGQDVSAYENWLSGQPDNLGGNKKCGHFVANTGKWGDYSCDQKLRYICEIPTKDYVVIPNDLPSFDFSDNSVQPVSPPHPNFSFPPSSDAQGLQKQFLMISNNTQSWNEAYEMCALYGFRLASIESLDENQAALSMLKEAGLQNNEMIWISGTKKFNQWSWAGSGKLIEYTNWKTNQPDNWNGNEECLQFIVSDTGVWNDMRCDRRFLFMCEKPIHSGTGDGSWGLWFVGINGRRANADEQVIPYDPY